MRDLLLGGEGSNLHCRIQSPVSCRLDDPDREVHTVPCPCEGTEPNRRHRTTSSFGLGGALFTRFRALMGSLVKKRRKRMRKKKHKKMLKRTRFQRRAAGK